VFSSWSTPHRRHTVSNKVSCNRKARTQYSILNEGEGHGQPASSTPSFLPSMPKRGKKPRSILLRPSINSPPFPLALHMRHLTQSQPRIEGGEPRASRRLFRIYNLCVGSWFIPSFLFRRLPGYAGPSFSLSLWIFFQDRD
jgi:hypothetical protein